MVECEFHLNGLWQVPATVLIDTWWNVNDEYTAKHGKPEAVLIDTWWNVNVVINPRRTEPPSFNRYMVECEFVFPVKSGELFIWF